MSKDETSSPAKGKPSAQGAKQQEREARLAAALRENLRKRKAQARARVERGPTSDEGKS